MKISIPKNVIKFLLILLTLIVLVPVIFIAEGLLQLAISKIIDIKDLFGYKVAEIFNLSLSLIASISVISIYMKYIHKDSIKNIGFSLKNKKGDILFGLALGFILIAIGFLTLVLMGRLEIHEITFDPISIFFSLITMILVSFHEEIITRGYLLNVLTGLSSKIAALILSSLYFALFHITNNDIGPVPLINIFMAGLILGVPYIFTKNLWFPIAFHFSWNFFQGPIFGFNVSGHINDSLINHSVTGSDLITGGGFGFEGSIISLILLILSTVLLYFYYRKRTALTKKVKLNFSDNQLFIQEEKQ